MVEWAMWAMDERFVERKSRKTFAEKILWA
jgi:hypothetical protein